MKRKLLNRSALDQHPLPPIVDGDKESKGRLLVIAGSREVPGAALLTATAAMRAGAGKLRIATVESAAPYLELAMPEAMVVGLPEVCRWWILGSCQEAHRCTGVRGRCDRRRTGGEAERRMCRDCFVAS